MIFWKKLNLKKKSRIILEKVSVLGHWLATSEVEVSNCHGMSWTYDVHDMWYKTKMRNQEKKYSRDFYQ